MIKSTLMMMAMVGAVPHSSLDNFVKVRESVQQVQNIYSMAYDIDFFGSSEARTAQNNLFFHATDHQLRPMAYEISSMEPGKHLRDYKIVLNSETTELNFALN